MCSLPNSGTSRQTEKTVVSRTQAHSVPGICITSLAVVAAAKASAPHPKTFRVQHKNLVGREQFEEGPELISIQPACEKSLLASVAEGGNHGTSPSVRILLKCRYNAHQTRVDGTHARTKCLDKPPSQASWLKKLPVCSVER